MLRILISPCSSTDAYQVCWYCLLTATQQYFCTSLLSYCTELNQFSVLSPCQYAHILSKCQTERICMYLCCFVTVLISFSFSLLPLHYIFHIICLRFSVHQPVPTSIHFFISIQVVDQFHTVVPLHTSDFRPLVMQADNTTLVDICKWLLLINAEAKDFSAAVYFGLFQELQNS